MSSDGDKLGSDPLAFLPAERHEVTLHPLDAAALDEVVDGVPVDAGRAEASRRARVGAWLKVLEKAQGTEAPADLAAKTLAAVEKCREHEEGDIRTEALRSRRFFLGRHIGKFAAVGAAAILLLVVVVPGVARARERAKETQCVANLDGMGKAMANYAVAHAGALPTLGSTADGNWLPHKGAAARSGHSNTANLFPLVRAGYVGKEKLVCPALGAVRGAIDVTGDEISDDSRGYSYVNMFGPAPGWDGKTTTIILADRNPIFAGEGAEGAFENSMNHGRKGTNVLNAAGVVEWVTSPNIGPGGDNIWTISSMPRGGYTGRERAASVEDAFLSP